MSRTKNRRLNMSNATLTAARMLIASYFLASAGLIENAAGSTFLSAVLPADIASLAATAIFYATGFALMVGRFVREAALVLAAFVCWASFGTVPLGGGLVDVWRDMALVGAVILIGLTHPQSGRSAKSAFSRRRNRRPRRIIPTQAGMARKAIRPEPSYVSGDDEDNIFRDLGTA